MGESELELYKIVGEMFREIRMEKGHSLEYVSDYLGIAPKSLQRYECGERKIKIGIIKSFCDFYSLNCSNFMKEAKIRFVSDNDILNEPKLNLVNCTEYDTKIRKIIEKAKELNSEGLSKLNAYADDLISSGNYNKIAKKELAI